MRLAVLLTLLLSTVCAVEWDAYNFPNPTAGQFAQCKMRSTANICDPDGVLSEQARYRLDHDLKQLESRTRQDGAQSFCDKKGVTAAMAIVRHVKGGTTEAVKTMANDMLQKWTLDSQCQKAVVIVVSTDDMKFWVARDDKVPVYADEFTEIFMQNKQHFQQKNYQQAMTNILQGTWERALSKQGSPRAPSGGNRGGQQPYDPSGYGGGGGNRKPGPAFKMPSIPSWFWLFVVFIVLPLLCCCCCLYCCCCRGKGGSPAAPSAPQGGYQGPGGQQPVGRGAGGGGRGPLGNFLSSAGGAGVGSLLGRLLSSGGGNRGGGGYAGGGGNRGMGMAGYQGGGAHPSSPIYDDNNGQGGGGLYPSRAVKDQGGGGSWA